VLLIEEKIGVGFAIVYPNKCVARGEKFVYAMRDKTATFATPSL
jgi:hypothetical protein